MHTELELKSRGGWALGLLLGVALTLGACGKDEPEDKGMKPGAQGEAAVTATEPTRLELSVKAGQLYRFVCTATTMTGCKVQLRDATTLEPVGEARLSLATKQLNFFWTAATTGLAVLDVQSALEGEAGAFQYEFTEAADDAGDSADGAVPQPFSETEHAFIGFLERPDDVDAWRLTVPANHILRAVCSGFDGANRDPDMELIRPDGTLLGTYNAVQFNGGIADMAIKNAGGGDLLLRVRASGPYSANSTRYGCKVRDAGPDDHGDVAAEATAVTVPARVRVDLGAQNEVDVLAVDLVAGHEYLLRDDSNNSSPFHASTTVTDAQGQLLGAELASDRTGVSFVPPTTGRYFLALKRARGFGIWKWLIPEAFGYEITDVTP
ncbi:hypothetical protein OV207_30085 [Corallococcus sp. BB11-1]|uniref:hypothetical protein n=1 Tax=Corallococcus sp. BB11-1 TaxID=2996783 RepID=UPI0022704F91|nr:hypothetical protein [Corallococcus sp. BB11-1]MCY1035728.1 hypothetical protein [Corallococcus sp. BB11-1]